MAKASFMISFFLTDVLINQRLITKSYWLLMFISLSLINLTTHKNKNKHHSKEICIYIKYFLSLINTSEQDGQLLFFTVDILYFLT